MHGDLTSSFEIERRDAQIGLRQCNSWLRSQRGCGRCLQGRIRLSFLRINVLSTDDYTYAKTAIMHVCTRYMAHCNWRFVVALRQGDDVQLVPRPQPDCW